MPFGKTTLNKIEIEIEIETHPNDFFQITPKVFALFASIRIFARIVKVRYSQLQKAGLAEGKWKWKRVQCGF